MNDEHIISEPEWPEIDRDKILKQMFQNEWKICALSDGKKVSTSSIERMYKMDDLKLKEAQELQKLILNGKSILKDWRYHGHGTAVMYVGPEAEYWGNFIYLKFGHQMRLAINDELAKLKKHYDEM